MFYFHWGKAATVVHCSKKQKQSNKHIFRHYCYFLSLIFVCKRSLWFHLTGKPHLTFRSHENAEIISGQVQKALSSFWEWVSGREWEQRMWDNPDSHMWSQPVKWCQVKWESFTDYTSMLYSSHQHSAAGLLDWVQVWLACLSTFQTESMRFWWMCAYASVSTEPIHHTFHKRSKLMWWSSFSYSGNIDPAYLILQSHKRQARVSYQKIWSQASGDMYWSC